MSEEEARAKAWAEMSAGDRQRAIAEAEAQRLWYGTCQRCSKRIEAIGGIKHCPHCGARG